MLAYSLFTIAMLHAVLISMVEKRLHQANLPRVLRSLPPLLTMEKLLFRMIGLGFVLLTLTLISGVFFSEEIFGKAWQLSHKVIFGLISWGCSRCCCGAMFIMAHAENLQCAGRWSASCFCCWLISAARLYWSSCCVTFFFFFFFFAVLANVYGYVLLVIQ